MVDENKTNSSSDPSSQFPGMKPDNNFNEKTPDSINVKSSSASSSAKSKSWKDKFMSKGLELWPHTKKQKTIGMVIIAVLLIVGSITVFALNKFAKKPYSVSNSTVTHTEKDTEPSKLTGLEVPKSINDRLVYSIQIENSPDARPQSGLYDAGVVYEAIAEGGITRFNASFLDKKPDYVGPVRSVRPYYADLAAPFDPVFVHAGGSGEGLSELGKLKLKDIDGLTPGRPFQRINSRPAPHNLYTSISGLTNFATQHKYKTSKTKSFTRNKKEAPASKPSVTKIDVHISGPLYDSHYDYDKKSNSYKRKIAGAPQVDARAKKQLQPKVVVLLITDYSKNGIYSVYRTTGSGSAFILQDGKLLKTTWKRGGKKDSFKFYDQSGKEVALNAGQTWVTLLGNKNQVKFSP